MLALEADQARHAAAAGVHLLDLESRPAEGSDRRRRANERLLVAVTVKQRLPTSGAERERQPARPLTQEKLLKQNRLPGDGARVVRAHEVHRLVAQRQKARGLEPDDRDAPPRVWRQTPHVPGGVLPRLGEHPLGDERSATALAVHEHDTIAPRL